MRYRRWVISGVSTTLDLGLDVVRTHAVEQSDSFAEQHGREVNLQFVEQSRVDELLNGVPSARHVDVRVARGCACLLQGALQAIGDEPERRPSILDQGVSRIVGAWIFELLQRAKRQLPFVPARR